ncbi:MAG: phage portal protein [Burkholderiales bacterium]|nr:phage portal protein [Burkholderiales bacterium]
MNWLDSMIGYLSPATGARRIHARIAMDMARSYDAGRRGRRTANWRAGGGSANAEILPDLQTVRNRCRDMVRNNEYAAKALDTMVGDLVGTGIVARAADQQVWMDWCDYCDADEQLDFNGLIELLVRGRKEVGEGLVRFRPRRPEDGLAVPLQVQVLEADHLDSYKTGPLSNGNFVIAGVEFDQLGRRRAYWLYPVHPGEVASYRVRSLESKRVPAEDVIHYYRKRRASQVRGMAEMAVALMRLRDLADYEQAELVRKKIEACFVAFVRTDDSSQTLGGNVDLGDKRRKPGEEKVSPGMIKYLSGADGVEFGSPASSGGYGEYTRSQLYAVSAGTGVMYSSMTGDHSQANYSSMRSANMDYRKLIAQEQWLALVPMVLNRVAARVQAAAVLAGVQKARPQRYEWAMPKVDLVDPLKDIMATKEGLRGGLQSLSAAIRERGDDPGAVFREIADERARLKELGILSDADPAVSDKLIPPEVVAELLGAK